MSIKFNNRPASPELVNAWRAASSAEAKFLELLKTASSEVQDAFEKFLDAEELVLVEQSLNNERISTDAEVLGAAL